MDKLEIYKNIKTIADELCKENKTYLRADLAFELKTYQKVKVVIGIYFFY